MTERKHLPDTRNSITKKLVIKHPDREDTDVYITVGLYDDGRPGELFVKAGKMGGTISGLLDAVGISISLGLQHGIPLQAFTTKFTNMAFEPDGRTDDPEIKRVRSILDGVARWLDRKFPT